MDAKAITDAVVTVGNTYIYSGAALTPAEADVSVTLDGKTLTGTTDYTIDASNNVDAGTATVTVAGTGNYTGTASGDFTIAPKPISITAVVPAERDFAAGNTAVEIQSVSLDEAGLAYGTDYTATGAMSDDTAGESKSVDVTVTLLNNNYALAIRTATATAKINKIDHATEAAVGSAKYGQSSTVNLNTKIAEGGTLGSLSVTDTDSVLAKIPIVRDGALHFAFKNVAENAGKTATITVPVSNTTNYNDYSILITVTVADREHISPAVIMDGWVYGQQAKTPSVSGNTGKGEVSYLYKGRNAEEDTYSATIPSQAGEYTVKASIAMTEQYAAAEATANFTITRAPLTITAKDRSISVNETLPDLTSGEGYTVAGLLNGDMLTTLPALAYSAAPDVTKAGTYSIVPSNADAGSNYEITYKSGTLTITSSAPSNTAGGSGGAGGSVSSGGAAPQQSGDKKNAITISGSNDEVQVQVTLSGDTVTVSRLSNTQIASLVSSGESANELIIDLSGLESNTNNVVIPAESFSRLVEAMAQQGGNSGLSIKTQTGEITFDETALKAIATEATSGNVILTFETLEKDKLNSLQKAALDAKDNVSCYGISLSVNGKAMTSFAGGIVTVTIPFPLKNGDGNHYAAWYANDNGTLERRPTRYRNGELSFTTTHLSEYIISYEKRAFSDVPNSAWYYDAIYYNYDSSYFKGITDTRFAPNNTMTRAMFATVLYRIAGEPETTGTSVFEDVAAGNWYTGAVTWASNEKILEGYGHSRFGTNDSITREQMVTVLWRYSGKPTPTGTDMSQFTDSENISTWAREAFEWAISKGIISGNGKNTLAPKDMATRAEVAQIVMNYNSVGK